jgi:hypothetical protein
MVLVYDRRGELGDQPGLHALITGVSAYTNLPKGDQAGTPDSMDLYQLTSAALSAYKVYRWLVDHQHNLPVPLATCRLLLSPSSEELAAEATLNGLGAGTNLNNFLLAAKDWRQDAASNLDNMTFFYFAGHGAQRTKDDAVLLLEDFGDGLGGPLKNAVDLGNIFKGMAWSTDFPNMAQTQLYFADACRDFLGAFKDYEPDDTTQVFRVELGGEDRRCAPIFFAAVPGTKAYALVGEQSLFTEALLTCMNNDAGDFRELPEGDKWCVTVHSLSEALSSIVDDLNLTRGADQVIVLGGLVREKILHYLEHAPTVNVSLEIEPGEAIDVARFEILDELGQPLSKVPYPMPSNPYRGKWEAGFYTISATIQPPDARFVDRPGRVRPVMPPIYQRKVKLTP